MFRLHFTLFQGFPGAWLNICIPCIASHSPLIEPDVRLSRIRLSRDIHRRHALLNSLQQLGQLVKLLSQMNKVHRINPDLLYGTKCSSGLSIISTET